MGEEKQETLLFQQHCSCTELTVTSLVTPLAQSFKPAFDRWVHPWIYPTPFCLYNSLNFHRCSLIPLQLVSIFCFSVPDGFEWKQNFKEKLPNLWTSFPRKKKIKQQASDNDVPESGKTVGGSVFLYLAFFLFSRFQAITFFLYNFSYIFAMWSSTLKFRSSERLK